MKCWGVLLGVALLQACAPAPEPIRFGEETCVYCRMGIADPRYGAEIVTRTGRVYKFDALECMIAFEDAGKVDSTQVHSRWVIDFAQPGQLIRLEEAEFVFAPDVPSPMGLNVYAVRRSTPREGLPAGQPVSWSQVVQMARRVTP